MTIQLHGSTTIPLSKMDKDWLLLNTVFSVYRRGVCIGKIEWTTKYVSFEMEGSNNYSVLDKISKKVMFKLKTIIV